MNRIFYAALTASLAIHSAGIIVFSFIKVADYRKPLKSIEVTYHKIENKESKQIKPETPAVQMVEMEPPPGKIELLAKEPARQDRMFEKIRDISKLSKEMRVGKKQTLPRIDPDDIHRKITIPVLSAEKISSPQYLTYNEAIRARIRQEAYHYIDARELKNGDIYLTFVLSNAGELKALRIVEERSEADDFLRKIGTESIEASQPFPPFPRDLNYQELTFNIKISFQVN
jgi:hypothetical protein